MTPKKTNIQKLMWIINGVGTPKKKPDAFNSIELNSDWQVSGGEVVFHISQWMNLENQSQQKKSLI